MSDSFPERLRLAREHLGLSETVMANRCGVSTRQTWGRYEDGGTRPNSDVLAALDGMGIDIHWLLTGEGSMLRQDNAQAQADRLYEVAVAATLDSYKAARLEAPASILAGMVSRAVKMIRSRPDAATMTDDAIRTEVRNILDVARAMLSQTGWSPSS